MPQAFPPLGPEYEPFLYAVIGDEQNGAPLTINSAIARSGADPWKEAARLARLPKAAALEALARIVPNHDSAETRAVAERLLALLPTPGLTLLKTAPETRAIKPLVIFAAVALFVCLVLAAAFNGPSHGDGRPSQPSAAGTAASPRN